MKQGLCFSFLFLALCGARGLPAQPIEPSKSIFADTMVDMSWPEVQRSATSGAVVIFPIAVIEEHGPHMDLSPDVYLGCFLSRRLREELGRRGIASVIAPPMYWGISAATVEFPGTFSVKPATFKAILRDAIENLKSWGYSKVFLSNFHGDPLHCRTLSEAASEIRESLGVGVYSIDAIYAELDHRPTPRLPPPPGRFRPDVHAGADETAAMAWLHPDHVNAALAANLKPQSDFRPLGYKGDPAGHVGVKDAGDLFRYLAELHAERIEALLREEGLPPMPAGKPHTSSLSSR